MVHALLLFMPILPASMQLEILRTAQRQMHPLHPDLPQVVLEINALENRS